MVQRMQQLPAAQPVPGAPRGFRALLWYQGESDAHQTDGHTLPGTDYRAHLERVIQESRKAAGWDVPWFIAQATWGSPTTPADPDIRAAQQAVWQDGLALPGPDTDTLLGDNRQNNGTGVHMTDKGLHAHADLWLQKIVPWLDQTLKVPPSKVP